MGGVPLPTDFSSSVDRDAGLVLLYSSSTARLLDNSTIVLNAAVSDSTAAPDSILGAETSTRRVTRYFLDDRSL